MDLTLGPVLSYSATSAMRQPVPMFVMNRRGVFVDPTQLTAMADGWRTQSLIGQAWKGWSGAGLAGAPPLALP